MSYAKRDSAHIGPGHGRLWWAWRYRSVHAGCAALRGGNESFTRGHFDCSNRKSRGNWISHRIFPGKQVGFAVSGHFIMAVFTTLVSRRQPDLIICGHINLLPLARLAAIRSQHRWCCSSMALMPGNRHAARNAARLVSKADLILSISEITRQRFISWSRVTEERVQLLPNAIKLDRYGEGEKNPELLNRYGLEGKCVLMTLGRLAAVQRHKGVDEVIQVMPRLLEEFPEPGLPGAGGGDDIDRLHKKALDHGVDEHVIFTGMVEEAEKADHYRLADAFALTGFGDGFGFVLLEAMACGIPVVASELDGSREAVLDGELGRLVDPSDPDSLVEGIALALRKEKAFHKA